jgi:hypothetical protein
MSKKATSKTTVKPKTTKASAKPETKKERTAKQEIALKALVLPAGVEMIQKKTAITFVRGEKKAVLKGRALEVTNILKEMGSRLRTYSADVIEKCHLGSIQGVINGVEDTVDLNSILAKYFKSSSKKPAKTLVAA